MNTAGVSNETWIAFLALAAMALLLLALLWIGEHR